MGSNHQDDDWFMNDRQPFFPMDEVIAEGMTTGGEMFSPSLDTIQEVFSDPDWNGRLFGPIEQQESYQPATGIFRQQRLAEETTSSVGNELAHITSQIRQLQQDMAELQAIFLDKIAQMEKKVARTEEYITSATEWSQDVHEHIERLLEVVKRQEEWCQVNKSSQYDDTARRSQRTKSM